MYLKLVLCKLFVNNYGNHHIKIVDNFCKASKYKAICIYDQNYNFSRWLSLFIPDLIIMIPIFFCLWYCLFTKKKYEHFIQKYITTGKMWNKCLLFLQASTSVCAATTLWASLTTCVTTPHTSGPPSASWGSRSCKFFVVFCYQFIFYYHIVRCIILYYKVL